MALFFGSRKKQEKDKIENQEIYLRIKFRRLYLEQLNRLEKNLQQENIDSIELSRLRTILKTQFCKTQLEDWKQFQKIIKLFKKKDRNIQAK
jgi:hypothetical protein